MLNSVSNYKHCAIIPLQCFKEMAPRKEINLEIRKLIVKGRKSGESYGQLAKKYKISRNGVVRICKKFATTKSVENIAG